MAKPVYEKPTGVQATLIAHDELEVVWRTPEYSNFYVVKYSTNSDMSDASYIRPIDVDRECPPVNANAYTLTELYPETKYYFRVAVCNWEGTRLSPYSVIKNATTLIDPAV